MERNEESLAAGSKPPGSETGIRKLRAASGPTLEFCDFGEGLAFDFRVISEAGEPSNVGFAAEPGHLTLGVVAMGLLDGLENGFRLYLAAQQLHDLLVAERAQGPGGIAISREQALGFFDQSGYRTSVAPAG